MNNVSPSPQKRLLSLDAYRGFVMFLMVAEIWHLCRVSGHLPQSVFWQFLCHHQSHVAWIGCSLHDLIQPAFSFIVGVALPFSIAGRLARGDSRSGMILHAIRRSAVLILLGVFLRTLGQPPIYITFEDTLTQIGLGYALLFLLGFRPARDQWIALGTILIGYWLAFALFPVPGPEFDHETVGVAKDWPHMLTGFAAHWNKNTNIAAFFDQWFLNLWPFREPFLFNGGGYQTLNFIPTLGTMILGLIAGGVLRSKRSEWAKMRFFLFAGCSGLIAGWLLHHTDICPVVKRIWTPSWTLFSGGWCFLLMAGFFLVIEIGRMKRWAFPLVVIGMNSILIYCMSWTLDGLIVDTFHYLLGRSIPGILGGAYGSLLSGSAVVAIFWLILYWLYRRRIFVRI